jgi:hypothetical protein
MFEIMLWLVVTSKNTYLSGTRRNPDDPVDIKEVLDLVGQLRWNWILAILRSLSAMQAVSMKITNNVVSETE